MKKKINFYDTLIIFLEMYSSGEAGTLFWQYLLSLGHCKNKSY